MNIIELNEKIEAFVCKHDLSNDALALKKEHSIQKSTEWQALLNELDDSGRMLRIGIIGRVKAGKSSMLNALLFNGNDILPKAATPMTAALTVMEYSDTVRAEVDFFSQADIDEMQKRHDEHLRVIERKTQENIEREKERNKPKGLRDKLVPPAPLTPEQLDKCKSRAERDSKDEPSYASYDQYCRIKASGKTLADLAQYKTLKADSVQELMNGELNRFVGASGEFMPFTKSVTLYIPEEGLKGLQIIDTPGINDPVTSRGERTEQLLQECDVVLIVSPAAQFFSNEDKDLLHRVTTKEGTQQAYLIASKIDDSLCSSEKGNFTHPNEVMGHIAGRLTNHARNVLKKLLEEYPQMKVSADKLMQNNVICASGVAFAMHQRFDQRAKWDGTLNKAWENLSHYYPDVFAHDELAKAALEQIASVGKIHQVVDEVRSNKVQILQQRRINFEQDKHNALQNYLHALQARINSQIQQIQTADVGELRAQEQQLKGQQERLLFEVGGVYDDLLSDIKLNLDKTLKDKLNNEMKQYDSESESAQGTTTESKRVYVGRGGFLWLQKKYETRHYEVQTVQASTVRRFIESVRDSLEDELRFIAESYSQAWKKKIYSQVTSKLREIMGDADLDVAWITRAVRNVLECIPEASFKLESGIPGSLKKTGKLKGKEAEEYMSAAADYMSDLRQTIRDEITRYMNNFTGSVKQVNLPRELTRNLENNLQQLLHEIENKEASLSHYENMLKELETLKDA